MSTMSKSHGCQHSNIALADGLQFGPVFDSNNALRGNSSIGSPPLGVLEQMQGLWIGKGFNTIFRPMNSKTPPSFNNPIGPNIPLDNVLELNYTDETLHFSRGLGDIPNRGSDPQGDIDLNGLVYLQTINDVTFKGPSPTIHVETGIWIRVPPTQLPFQGTVFTRMASIPHGTTVLAQGSANDVPFQNLQSGQFIFKTDITPFDSSSKQIVFASQTVGNTNTPRIPQVLDDATKLNRPITQDILTDPNTFIRNHIGDVHFLKVTELKVATGTNGTSNIDFLTGEPTDANSPNANATVMESTFWIEEIVALIDIPSGVDPIQFHEVAVKVTDDKYAPRFKIQPVAFHPAKQILVKYVQIQYSQKVNLVFKTLTWPHVSVSTLVNKEAIPWSLHDSINLSKEISLLPSSHPELKEMAAKFAETLIHPGSDEKVGTKESPNP